MTWQVYQAASSSDPAASPCSAHHKQLHSRSGMNTRRTQQPDSHPVGPTTHTMALIHGWHQPGADAVWRCTGHPQRQQHTTVPDCALLEPWHTDACSPACTAGLTQDSNWSLAAQPCSRTLLEPVCQVCMEAGLCQDNGTHNMPIPCAVRRAPALPHNRQHRSLNIAPRRSCQHALHAVLCELPHRWEPCLWGTVLSDSQHPWASTDCSSTCTTSLFLIAPPNAVRQLPNAPGRVYADAVPLDTPPV
jgi:hypothetical protein